MLNKQYIESDSRTVQGKRQDIFKQYGKEWRIQEQGHGNGNWLLTKKSDVLVDGKSYRSFILEHYDRVRLTYNLYEKFKEDVEAGEITLS